MAFQDHFSRQAQQYTQFRPRYPRALFEFLASLPALQQRAWDCGTGNGQAAVDLAAWFEEVIATDPSTSQIAHAEQHPGVSYLVCAAEQCPLADGSVDLITVAQALHWFDLDRFYRQVRRVGRAGSVLAAWSYGLARITPAVDRVVGHLYADLLGPFWPKERKLIEQGYATVAFPFEELRTPALHMEAQWQLGDLIGYLGTWSATQRYLATRGENPLEKIEPELSSAWGSESTRRVSWPLFARVGRVH